MKTLLHWNNNNRTLFICVVALLHLSRAQINYDGLFDGWGNGINGDTDDGIGGVGNADDIVEVCPPVTKHYTAEYHLDTVCNREAHNKWRADFKREETQAKLQETKTFNKVPNAQTLYCPDEDEDESSSTTTELDQSVFSKNQIDGFETMWIVKNTGSRPVVVSFLQRWHHHGGEEEGHHFIKEVSALDPTIHPAHLDPKAILKPGEWKAIHTYEGHAFRVREIINDGGTTTPGRVLVQHRVGHIPITNKSGGDLPVCDPNEADHEPILGLSNYDGLEFAFLVDPVQVLAVFLASAVGLVTFLVYRHGVGGLLSLLVDSSIVSKIITGVLFLSLFFEIQIADLQYDPNYARSGMVENRPCNALDIGFRNEAGCPLNAYYTGMQELQEEAPSSKLDDQHEEKTNYANNNNNETCSVDDDTGGYESISKGRGNNMQPGQRRKKGGKHCRDNEQFKFHLGLNRSPNSFMWDWDSTTKFESTYVGHSFLFRLARDEDIIVDEITIEPTYVPDCPEKKKKKVSVVQHEEAIVSISGESIKQINLTEYLLDNNNTTETQQLNEDILSNLGSTISSAQNNNKKNE